MGRTYVRRMINVSKVNEVYMLIETETSITREISDYFSFLAPGYLFSKAYENDLWDGRIRPFKAAYEGGLLYIGLLPLLEKFAEVRDYPISVDNSLIIDNGEFDVSEINKLVITSDKNEVITPYDYQVSSVKFGMEKERLLIKSATGSGKSLQAYLFLRLYQELFELDGDNRHFLLIVPTAPLVKQMYTDFGDYSQQDQWDVKENCHKVAKGVKIDLDKRVTITTWQAIYKEPKEYFDQYGVVICDEVHKATAKSLTGIMEKLDQCQYRIGMTGTLKDAKSNKISLVGLFGRVHTAITTRELIDSGRATNINIKVVVLQYGKEYAKTFNETVREKVYNEEGDARWSYKLAYAREMKILTESKRRNRFISNLTKKMTNNTLVLFKTHVHGEALLELFQKDMPDRKIYYITGKVPPEERERIRIEANASDNIVILATYSTFSTGVNIKNLHNIIYGVPIESEYTNIQSIGRAIRLMAGKTEATLYDIADDIKHGKRKNYSLKHMESRILQYSDEKHNFKIIKVKMT